MITERTNLAIVPTLPGSRRRTFLPSEHGFWAMLFAVLLAALLRVPLTIRAVLAAFVVSIVAAVAGGFVRRTIRQSGSAQLISAAALAFAGVPVEIAGGGTLRSMAAAAFAWVAVLVGSASVVRAAFARAARDKQHSALWLDVTAVTLPVTACVAFVVLGCPAEARAAATAAAGLGALVLARPTIKQMKRVGLALTSFAIVAALALGT